MAAESSSSNVSKIIRVLQSENALLKARLYEMGKEKEDFKKQLQEIQKELKETQALLGRAVVNESLSKQKMQSTSEVKASVSCPTPGPSTGHKRRANRSRSPSFEIVEIVEMLPVKKEESVAPGAATKSSVQYKIISRPSVSERAPKRQKLDSSASSSGESKESDIIMIDLTLCEVKDEILDIKVETAGHQSQTEQLPVSEVFSTSTKNEVAKTPTVQVPCQASSTGVQTSPPPPESNSNNLQMTVVQVQPQQPSILEEPSVPQEVVRTPNETANPAPSCQTPTAEEIIKAKQVLPASTYETKREIVEALHIGPQVPIATGEPAVSENREVVSKTPGSGVQTSVSISANNALESQQPALAVEGPKICVQTSNQGSDEVVAPSTSTLQVHRETTAKQASAEQISTAEEISVSANHAAKANFNHPKPAPVTTASNAEERGLPSASISNLPSAQPMSSSSSNLATSLQGSPASGLERSATISNSQPVIMDSPPSGLEKTRIEPTLIERVDEAVASSTDPISAAEKEKATRNPTGSLSSPVITTPSAKDTLPFSSVSIRKLPSTQPIASTSKLAPSSQNSLASIPRMRSSTSKSISNSVSRPASVMIKKSTGKEVLRLSPSVVETYLQSAPTLEINPPPLDIEVSRAFLRVAYGGNDRMWLQHFHADRNPSGYYRRGVVFPMLSLNPCMPSSPGKSGLIFASRHEILENLPWTVFCKRSSAAPAVWLYLGEYENTLVGAMTAEQFRSQTPHVQREWAMSILTCKQLDVYVGMRARIALRKAGIIPVTSHSTAEENEREEKSLIETEMLEIKCDQGMPVARDDIIKAFSKGDEAIDIIRMRCVKYDHIFANDMKEKLPQYSGMLAAGKQKKAVRASNTRRNTRLAKSASTNDAQPQPEPEPEPIQVPAPVPVPVPVPAPVLVPAPAPEPLLLAPSTACLPPLADDIQGEDDPSDEDFGYDEDDSSDVDDSSDEDFVL